MVKTQRPADSGASGSSRDTSGVKKRRIVDCAKTLLDIAKESADWFPPLKSALRGVSALIKHYEQFEDVKEKVEELVPQLDRFKQYITTTTVDGDPEETNRRIGLARIMKIEIPLIDFKVIESWKAAKGSCRFQSARRARAHLSSSLK